MWKTELKEEPKMQIRGESINYFDYVPDEILYKIVSMLPKIDLIAMAEVNQRFYRVCCDKRLCKIISLVNQQITFFQLRLLIMSSLPIEELNLRSTCILGPRPGQENLPGPHMTLKKLDLTQYHGYWKRKSNLLHWPRTSDMIILDKCRTKKLILDRPWQLPHTKVMEAISKQVNLEVLSMEFTNFSLVGFDDFRKLFQGYHRLKELNLTACYLSSEQLHDICDHIPETVEKLILSKMRVHKKNIPIADHFSQRITLRADFNEDDNRHREMLAKTIERSFRILFRRAHNLKYFGAPFPYLPAVMDRMIQHPRLEALRLCGCTLGIRDFHLFLGKMEPKLKKIDVSLGSCMNKGEKEAFPAQLDKLRKTFIGIDVEAHHVGVFK